MSDKLDLRRIATEQRNPRTAHIDELPTIDMVRLINSEDKKVAEAVELVCPQIAEAIDLIYSRLRDGGRLVYCGCGTSGRLGVLDAVECPPTYSVDPDFVRGIIAGGYSAVFKAVEGAEDKRELGEQELRDAGLRVEGDYRAEKMGYKIREARLNRVPYLLIVGAKEEEEQKVSVRSRYLGDEGSKDLGEFIEAIKDEIAKKTIRKIEVEE